MKYILDGIAILILVITIIVGYRRGFLKSLVQFIGCVAAFILAFSLSAPAANFTFDTFLAEGLENTLTEALVTNADAAPTELLQSLPEPILAVLENSTQLQATLENLGDAAASTAETAVETLMTSVIRPVAVSLIQFVAFILLFVILMFVARLLAKVIKPITKLPLLRQVDGALGAVLGLIKGVLFTIAFVSVVQLIAATGSPDSLVTQEMVESSILVSWIAEINPLVGVIG